MSGSFRAVRISERVYWVGAIDGDVRNFHGYLTSRGTTYNAYLVLGSQPVLIDTVKAPFADEMMERIASVVEPSNIRCIISTHSEMDHSGALPQVVALLKPQQVIASTMGAKALLAHFHWDQVVRCAADGERIELGDLAFRFVEARMLHWPDSMLSYLEGDRVLFTNDAFGMHLATSERFADQIDPAILRWEAAKYFANILLPFAKKVTGLVERIPGLGLDIQTIAPDHGPVWRTNPTQIVDMYARWAIQKPTRKALVVFDTMWQSTAMLARAVAEGLTDAGISARLMPLSVSHRSDVAAELLDVGALVVGSPTLNNNLFPTMADLMTYLKGLAPANKVGAAFGSYGWSSRAVKQLNEILTEMGVELAHDGVQVQYVPDQSALDRARELGAAVAARLVEVAK